MDRLHVYSTSLSLSRIAFLGALAGVLLLGVRLDLRLALLLESFALLAAWSVLIAWLKPRWRTTLRWMRDLRRGARSYGLSVYVGRIMSIGTYNMDVLMVARYAGAREVALYTLANGLAAVVSLPGAGMASALFARLTADETLDRRWIAIAAGVGTVGILGAWGLGGPTIRLVFSNRYTAATKLVVPLASAEAIRGVTALFNSYLAAKGRGKELRTAAGVLATSNLALNIALIPPYGAMGAAWASLLALMANLGAHLVGYRRALMRGTSHTAIPPCTPAR